MKRSIVFLYRLICVFVHLGFHYPLYGKTAGREDSDGAQSSKPVTDSPALELLSHPLLPYHGKSPVVRISHLFPPTGDKMTPEYDVKHQFLHQHADTRTNMCKSTVISHSSTCCLSHSKCVMVKQNLHEY